MLWHVSLKSHKIILERIEFIEDVFNGGGGAVEEGESCLVKILSKVECWELDWTPSSISEYEGDILVVYCDKMGCCIHNIE